MSGSGALVALLALASAIAPARDVVWTYRAGAPVMARPTVIPGRSGGTVLVGAGTEVHALDARTGALLWKRRADHNSQMRPVLAGELTAPGRFAAVLEEPDGGTVAVAAETGEVLWRAQESYYTPLALGDVNADGRPDVVEAYGRRFQPMRLRARDGRDGRALWSFELPRGGGFSYGTPPVVGAIQGAGRPVVLVATNESRLVALDGPAGTQLWSERLWAYHLQVDDLTGHRTRNLTAFGSTISPSDCAILGVSVGERTYTVIWAFPTGRELASGMAAADLDRDRTPEIVVTMSTRVHALSAGDGRPKWRREYPPQRTWIHPVAIGDTDGDGLPEVVVPAPDLEVLDGATGRTKRAITLPGGQAGSPALADVDGDGRLEAVLCTSDERVIAVRLSASAASR